jgi:hypothetical protein
MPEHSRICESLVESLRVLEYLFGALREGLR